MYFFDWLIYDGRAITDYETLTREADSQIKNNEKLTPIRITQGVSRETTDNNSLYAYNSIYTDARTPNDEKRGLITFMIGGCGAALLWMLGITLYYAARDYSSEYKGNHIPLVVIDYILLGAIPLTPLTALYKNS